MPEPKDHIKGRGWIETIMRHVPGFRGYFERGYRREADQLQRQWLADRLQNCKRELDDLARDLAEKAQVDELPLCDRLRGRLDKLIHKIRGAMHGYSGFFDLVQVDVKMLDRVYEQDVKIMDEVEALAETVEKLSGRGQELEVALKGAMKQADELEDAWGKRSEILEGLS